MVKSPKKLSQGIFSAMRRHPKVKFTAGDFTDSGKLTTRGKNKIKRKR